MRYDFSHLSVKHKM